MGFTLTLCVIMTPPEKKSYIIMIKLLEEGALSLFIK